MRVKEREGEQDEDDVTCVKMELGQQVHSWSLVLYVLQMQGWYVVSWVWHDVRTWMFQQLPWLIVAFEVPCVHF